jgi:cellulose synthase/poly-beta-1,6-N-acetylglucosamine synthase-like glycosyltransferase
LFFIAVTKTSRHEKNKKKNKKKKMSTSKFNFMRDLVEGKSETAMKKNIATIESSCSRIDCPNPVKWVVAASSLIRDTLGKSKAKERKHNTWLFNSKFEIWLCDAHSKEHVFDRVEVNTTAISSVDNGMGVAHHHNLRKK